MMSGVSMPPMGPMSVLAVQKAGILACCVVK